MPPGKKKASASQASKAPANPRPSRRGQGTESTLESILSASQFKLVSERLHVVGQALKKFCASNYTEGQRIGSDQFFSFAGEQGGLSIPSATSLFSLGEWARQLGLVLRYDSYMYSPEEQKEKCRWGKRTFLKIFLRNMPLWLGRRNFRKFTIPTTGSYYS